MTAMKAVRYFLNIDLPSRHYIHVTMRIPDVPREGVALKMPAWLPGAYLINDFARNVESFKVMDSNGVPVRWRKIDKQTWFVTPESQGTLDVEYDVYAFSLEDDASYVCSDFAVINPGTVCLCVASRMDTPCILQLHHPWQRTATGLNRVEKETFRASDYHELMDCPILAGNHKVARFEVNGVPHDVIIEGKGNMDMRVFLSDLEKITRAEIEMMGGAPYQRYVYLILITDKDGGLEHRNSTLIFVRHFDFRPRKTYLETMTIFSHELFHAWNVKRLKPRELVHPDYFHETYTDMLWVSEGFTNYYHHRFLLRAGIMTVNEYLEAVAKQIHRYRKIPGYRYQNAMESSFDTWIKYYKPDENTPNSAISYYVKGSHIALILDLAMLDATRGKAGLDELMRRLYRMVFEEQDIGFTYEDIRREVETLAGNAVAGLLDELVSKRDDMPFELFAEKAGLVLKPKQNDNDKEPVGYLGVALEERDGRTWVRWVERSGPAWIDGFQAGDEIIAIDGFRTVSRKNLESRLKTYSPQQTVVFTISRRGVIREVAITLGEPRPKSFEFFPACDVSEAARRVFRAWTGHDFEELQKTAGDECKELSAVFQSAP